MNPNSNYDGNSLKILNLGCGIKTSCRPEVVNIDWSISLRIKKNRLLRAFVPLICNGERLTRFDSLSGNIMVCNLAKGIPFDFSAVDVVYHSHMLEHLDREVARKFLLEVKRVLKPGGVHRIVVPDLHKICTAYVSHFTVCDLDLEEGDKHDSYIAALIEQSVRRQAFGTSRQKPLRKFIENFILGDASRRGETHQWMYDRINLKAILINLGYKEVHIQEYNTSLISNWNEYGLDLDKNGNQYKPGSLYVEAVK